MGIPIDEVVADVASEIVLIVHYEGDATASCARRRAGADSAVAPLPTHPSCASAGADR